MHKSYGKIHLSPKIKEELIKFVCAENSMSNFRACVWQKSMAFFGKHLRRSSKSRVIFIAKINTDDYCVCLKCCKWEKIWAMNEQWTMHTALAHIIVYLWFIECVCHFHLEFLPHISRSLSISFAMKLFLVSSSLIRSARFGSNRHLVNPSHSFPSLACSLSFLCSYFFSTTTKPDDIFPQCAIWSDK